MGMIYSDDYDPDIERGEFTDSTVEQIEQMEEILDRLTGFPLDLLYRWVIGEKAYYYRLNSDTGVDWVIDVVKRQARII